MQKGVNFDIGNMPVVKADYALAEALYDRDQKQFVQSSLIIKRAYLP
jgi:hypothetical protein